ncbi:AzlC family ABC transporter permease [Fusobacterium sp. PH5-44]|uniref:AzlC family ABC transporter permease n=1 Tax=unclassified Fusobacterium TaxID=2648384 RepID=UPI003D21DD29
MKNFSFAIKQIVPLLCSYIFVGIAFGILINKEGYSFLWAFFSGLFVYAGSMQIVMINLMTGGIPLYMVAIITFFLNARHIFYGLGFIEKFRKMGWKYPYMVLTLTDETYSLLCSLKYPPNINEEKVNFYINLSCHLLWTISCTIGAIIGNVIPSNITKGIDFSATALFVTICVNQWKQAKSHIPAIIGIVSAIIFLVILGPDNFILPALSTSLIALCFLKDKVENKMVGDTNE